jgi:hypothetical protein
MSAIEREIDANFDFFQRSLGSFLPQYDGKFALIKNCTVVRFYDNEFEAEAEGEERFADGLYSIQQVSEKPADLGFFSYAYNHGQAGQSQSNY